jgi:hypothetical protein
VSAVVWGLLGAAALLEGFVVAGAVAWLRLGDLADLLTLLLYRRAGQTPPPIVSQYSGRW